MADVTTETINALAAVIGNAAADALAALFSRYTTSLNDAGIALTIKRITTGNMADGFGVAYSFQIRDEAGVDNEIARLTAVRNGADNTGQLNIQITNAGSIGTSITVTPGTTTVYTSLIARGGTLTAGLSGNTRGAITAVHGSGGNTPGYLRTNSPNGTPWYWFTEDDGTCKVSNAPPTQNSDGNIIGLQF